jgi:pantoate--beta-alanine ligase
MRVAAERVRAGEAVEAVLMEGRRALEAAGFSIDYLEIRNADTLAAVKDFGTEPLRLLAAARLGRVRLIDNMPVALAVPNRREAPLSTG